MTESEIQKELSRLFYNYEYALCNSFVFNWECDFFCMSKSGYFVEVEIKCSRSDFFKDFEKDKHKIFRDLVAGKKISVFKTGYNNRGDIAVKNFPQIRVEVKGRSYNIVNKIENGSEELIERIWDHDHYRYIVNDWQGRLQVVKHYIKDLYFPATSIGYHNMEETNVPNQLYYAVPEGMIKPHELPPYAGLIEVSHFAKQVKRAPYIHKRKMDLDRILLKKFYNLWRYKGRFVDETSESTYGNP